MTSEAAVVLDLVEAVGRVRVGEPIAVALPVPGDAAVVERWCRRTGHTLVERGPDRVVVRRAAASDPVQELPRERRPGARLWLYTNFDCNLACDYCCVRSSPGASRRALGLPVVRRIVSEAPAAGVRELFVTGGEPFLLPGIGDVLRECAAALPTTVLTNGMVFRGSRLDVLRALPRSNLTLQISLDSGDPDLHDRHRGAGSFARVCEGIGTATALGFHVKIAATVAPDGRGSEPALHALVGSLGIRPEDRLVRQVARRGFSDQGLMVGLSSLIPEVTVTARGVYWHPVGADDDDLLVTEEIFPLASAIARVTERFREERRRQDDVARLFPCA